MPYLGVAPNPRENREVDDISSSFNGSNTAFTLQSGGSNVSPGKDTAIIVSLGGVIQNPGTDYTIAASTITFTTAPVSGLSFFGVVLAQSIDIETVADNTVTTAKIVDGAITNAKVNASAAIAGTKISPDFGSQNIVTTGSISGAAGTFTGDVSIPDTIVHTGDTDTKIRFPNANVISFETAGADRFALGTSEVVVNDPGNDIDFRIEGDSDADLFKIDAGNDRVGIGTGSPNSLLNIHGVFETNAFDNANGQGGRFTSKGLLIGDAFTAGKTSSDDRNSIIWNERGLDLVFATSDTERMKIDSSGRVHIANAGLSATSSSDDLTVGNLSGDHGITIHSATDSAGFICFGDADSTGVGSRDGVIRYQQSDSSMRFATNGNNERMRIEDSGKVLVGTTSGSNFSSNVAEFVNATQDAAVGVRSTTGAENQDFILFKFGGGPSACGGVRRDGTTQGPEFFSNSDRRIKTNILDMDNTLDKINQLSLKKFDFKDGTGSGIGLIAQDLISIFPNKVKKDASDDGTGDTVPDGVDPWTVGHNFTYELLKAIQELTARVAALEAA